MEKISVIVPVYNTSAYLQKCLNSIRNQTYKDIQIICVDDGSTDCCSEILAENAQVDERIVVLQQKNNGLSKTRNLALTKATGKYVAFVDSDDWIDNQLFCEVIKAANHFDADIVQFPICRESKARSIPLCYFKKTEVFRGKQCKHMLRRIAGLVGSELHHPEQLDAYSPVWSKLYRTSLIKDNNLTFIESQEIGPCEDFFFNIQAYKHANCVINLPLKYYYHYRRDNSESIINTYKPELAERWSGVFPRLEKELGNEVGFEDALKNRKALYFIGVGLNEMESRSSIKKKLERIRQLASSIPFDGAFDSLDLKYMPIKWKLFFSSIKNRQFWVTTCLLCVMRWIIKNTR